MIEDLKKLVYASIGTAATVYEKGETLIKEMVEKGKITVEEGKELSQELKQDIIDKTNEATSNVMTKLDDIKLVSKEDVIALVEEYSFINREEVNELRERVRVLEEKLNEQT